MSWNSNTRKPLIDNRGDRAMPFGFVYLDRTRVVFEKQIASDGVEEMVLCPARHWPEPYASDMAAATAALIVDGLVDKPEEVRIA